MREVNEGGIKSFDALDNRGKINEVALSKPASRASVWLFEGSVSAVKSYSQTSSYGNRSYRNFLGQMFSVCIH